MGSNITIYHHLGLGDHIICHGIVRNYASSHNKVRILCKHHNLSSVKFMFKDLSNVEIVDVAGNEEAEHYLKEYGNNRWKTLRLTWTFQDYLRTGLEFDHYFYMLAGLDFQQRWSDFYVTRNEERENDLLKRISPKKPYIFVHDDPARGFAIDRRYLQSKFQVVIPQPDLTDNIFDYYQIIEGAEEFHGIDSCFALWADVVFIKKPLFFHWYSRKDINKAHYSHFKILGENPTKLTRTRAWFYLLKNKLRTYARSW